MMRGAGALGSLLFFFVVILGLGVLWMVAGGPARSQSHSGWLFSGPLSPEVNYGNRTYSGEGEDLTPVNSTPSGTAGATGDTEPETPLDRFFNFRRGSAAGAPDSPYAAYIQFKNGNTDASAPSEEYVTIETTRSTPNIITITGWTMESTVNAIKVPLGQAAQIPYLGQVNSPLPVTVGPDSEIFIVTGRSPNGTSFRVNKCAEYFAQFQNFTPRLRTDCPATEDEALLVSHKTAGVSACVDFIERLPSCEIYTDDIPLETGSSCRDFIVNDLTYAGCVSRHKNDPDFYANEWRLFLNRDQELWANAHDQILLRDENGKLIAEIKY